MVNGVHGKSNCFQKSLKHSPVSAPEIDSSIASTSNTLMIAAKIAHLCVKMPKLILKNVVLSLKKMYGYYPHQETKREVAKILIKNN